MNHGLIQHFLQVKMILIITKRFIMKLVTFITPKNMKKNLIKKLNMILIIKNMIIMINLLISTFKDKNYLMKNIKI
jgi:hypothetical protein